MLYLEVLLLIEIGMFCFILEYEKYENKKINVFDCYLSSLLNLLITLNTLIL
jgi:hypothetical protein